ncbi:hypothetical protein MPL3356_150321 [Mesorhizobium plurifarium]|uniref:Uncharacterized protein n=1 Tax=Mesorhizobium plurifarium TaxID=69974 RepID=A0A090F554_MESPL|nr:hypothetical protein MPL3356_150321 [Mesorhizobium plurifarium]CDX43794.1 hypothetical protein MPLA_680026 [Mesorhizobium sp. ORS 3359]
MKGRQAIVHYLKFVCAANADAFMAVLQYIAHVRHRHDPPQFRLAHVRVSSVAGSIPCQSARLFKNDDPHAGCGELRLVGAAEGASLAQVAAALCNRRIIGCKGDGL